MEVDSFNWDRLRIFRLVGELGSLTSAASRLKCSIPTVSRRVEELERELGSQLVVKTTNGVKLTPAGTQLLSHTQSMADMIALVRDDVSDIDIPAEGKVSLVTGDGLGPYWIAPRLPEFHRLNPKIELTLTVTDTVVDELYDSADIKVQFQKPTSPELIQKKLGVLHYIPFASEAYLKEFGTPKSIFEFEHHRCLLHSSYVNQIEQWSPKAANIKELVDFALITNSAAAMLSVCENGGGVALFPTYFASLYPQLVPLDFGEIAPIQFWMTYTERLRRLPRGQAVIDFLSATLNGRRVPWFRENFIHPTSMDDVDLELLETVRV